MTRIYTDQDTQDAPNWGGSHGIWAGALNPVEFDGFRTQAERGHHENVSAKVFSMGEHFCDPGSKTLEFEGGNNKAGRKSAGHIHLQAEADIL